MSDLDPFPFVVGCGRSGTTLLRAMLDSHPALSIPPESHFVVELALERDNFARDGAFDTGLFSSRLLDHERLRSWRIEPDTLRDEVVALAPRDFAAAVRAVFQVRAALEGKPRYGDKTPSYVLHIPLLAAIFPEAKFVHVIRDGRDVAVSMREVRWAPRGAEPAALVWRGSVQAGRGAGRRLGAERYAEVRYEQLVSEPERVLQGVCAFLEMPFTDAMLLYHERADRIVEGFDVTSEHRHLWQPPTPGVRDWRTEMAGSELRLFEAVAGDLLDELGYEVGPHARQAAAPSSAS